jgi:hypothetical protein
MPGYNICALKMYGGRPSNGMCERCIEREENNKAFAKALFEREELAHPKGVARISGCCDRADQD